MSGMRLTTVFLARVHTMYLLPAINTLNKIEVTSLEKVFATDLRGTSHSVVLARRQVRTSPGSLPRQPPPAASPGSLPWKPPLTAEMSERNGPIEKANPNR
eukprot:755451-Prorocentrum_minimum.AAC.1